MNARAARAPWPTAAFGQMLVALAVCGVTAGLALYGLAVITRPLFMVASVAAAWWYRRRSPWLYLTFTLWMWTLTPFVRRVIDYATSFDPADIILATPNLLALLMLPDLLASRRLLRRPEALLGLSLLLPAAYGLCISLVAGDVMPGAVGAAEWLTPLLYYFFVIEHAPEIDAAAPHLRGFVTWNALVVVSYGLAQFFSPLDWDVAWALASRMEGSSETTAGSIRVFSTLNAVGLLADWLAALILLSLQYRSVLSLILLPLAALELLLTYVRSVTVGVVLSLLLIAVLGGRRMSGGVLLIAGSVVVAGVGVAIYDPSLVEHVGKRLASFGELNSDTSAVERARLWAATPDLIEANPLGQGLGAFGRGAASAGNLDNVSVDAGPLLIYLSLGWVAGTVYLAGMVLIVGQALLGARRSGSQPALAFAAAALCGFSELPFVSINGFAGVVLWTCAGFAIAFAQAVPTAQRAPAAAGPLARVSAP